MWLMAEMKPYYYPVMLSNQIGGKAEPLRKSIQKADVSTATKHGPIGPHLLLLV